VNSDGHNCVPNKDRADFPPVLESDHTIAAVQGLSAQCRACVYLGHGLVGGSRRQPASISFSSAEARATAGQKRPAIRDGPKFRELPCRTAIATYDVSSGRGVFATHTQPPRELGSQLLLCLQPDFGWTAQFGAQYTTCEGS
jgi:hypothetical protein